jgi:DNA mismatch repair ATPase MutS
LVRMSKKFAKATASLQDVVRVYQVVKMLPEVVQILMDYQRKHADLLNEQFTCKLKVRLYSILTRFKLNGVSGLWRETWEVIRDD